MPTDSTPLTDHNPTAMSKLLIYDADCPLCRAYTKGLVVAGALPAEARMSSHAITDRALVDRLDAQRRRHEIPLIDTQTGETHYGVDAILTVTERTWPRLTRFVRDTLLFELGRQFYAFVSYNRRLLFPTPPDRPHIMDLTPDFNAAYRLVFLVVLYGLILLGHYASVGQFDPAAMGTLLGQWLLTSLYIVRHTTENRLANVLDYAGHLGMSIAVGAVFNAAGVALNAPALLLLGDALMIWQYGVRLRVMQLPNYLNLPFIGFVLLNQ